MRHPRAMSNVSFNDFYLQILVSNVLNIKFLIQFLFSWFALIPVQALNIKFLIQVLFSWFALIPVQALNIKFLIQVLFSWFALIPVQALNINSNLGFIFLLCFDSCSRIYFSGTKLQASTILRYGKNIVECGFSNKEKKKILEFLRNF